MEKQRVLLEGSRHGKTGVSGRVNRVTGQLGCGSGQVGLGLLVFFKQVFYFILFYIYFQLQKQINDNLFKENE